VDLWKKTPPTGVSSCGRNYFWSFITSGTFVYFVVVPHGRLVATPSHCGKRPHFPTFSALGVETATHLFSGSIHLFAKSGVALHFLFDFAN